MTPEPSNEDIARAFSAHRFEKVYDKIASDAIWTAVGHGQFEGRDDIVAACRGTEAEFEAAGVETAWERFVSTGPGSIVAVDAIGRYSGADGVSTVSSCDIYEFNAESIVAITSYAAELPTDDGYTPPL